MTGRRLSLWLCTAAVTLGLWAPTAFARTFEGAQPGQEPAPVNIYRLTLEAQTVGGGTALAYETVAPELAGNPFAADYYPGELIVELAGQIVIEDGGSLTIGTLSAGSEKEHSPVLRGACSPEGLIVVRPGGRLILKDVSLELEGQGLFIVQERGGLVELTDMEPEGGLIAWAPLMVNNTCQQPADLWLEEGTALAETMLPDALSTYVQDQGVQRWESVPIQWDTAPCGGQVSGEAALAGNFLDQDGAALPSVRPLTLTVHWYQPDKLIVTDTVWMGDTAASAKLELNGLPAEAAELWGEVSADGGETWVRWEQFERRGEGGHTSCVFSLPDSTPRHFRLRASNEREHRYWISDAFLLPEGRETPSDQGGNRGGSTAIVTPDRTPPPAPSPVPTPSPEPVPAPSPAPAPTPTPEPVPTPTPAPTPEPPAPSAQPSPSQPSGSTSPAPSASPEPSTSPAPSAPPEPSVRPSDMPSAPPEVTPEPAPGAERGREGPAPILQALLVGGGAALCVSVGIFAARRKRT